jgi:hypothetical protein
VKAELFSSRQSYIVSKRNSRYTIEGETRAWIEEKEARMKFCLRITTYGEHGRVDLNCENMVLDTISCIIF